MEAPVPSQQRAIETRQRLLDAALARIVRQGYEATSVAEVCDEAGLSKGAFYHHFSSKQALVVALLERWLEGIRRQRDAIDAETQAVPEALRRMAVLLRQVFSDAQGQLPLVLDFWSQARRDPAVWERTVSPLREFRVYFSDLLARGAAQGSLRPIDPEAGAQVLVSLAVGLVLQALLDPSGADWGAEAEGAVLALVRSLERAPRGANTP